MCMNCMAGAMMAGASATGLRAWLVVRFGSWLTPQRRRRVTVGLCAAGVLAASVAVPGVHAPV